MNGHGQYNINALEKTEKAEAAGAARLFQGKRKEKVKADFGGTKFWKIKKDRRMKYVPQSGKIMPLSINLKDSPYGKVASSVQPESCFSECRQNTVLLPESFLQFPFGGPFRPLSRIRHPTYFFVQKYDKR